MQLIWFSLYFHFARRGIEGWRELTKQSIVLFLLIIVTYLFKTRLPLTFIVKRKAFYLALG